MSLFWYFLIMSRRKLDWEKLKSEYVTSDISIKALSQKHKVDKNLIASHCKDEQWVKARKDYKMRVGMRTITKSCDKESTKRANELTGLLDSSYMLRDRIKDAIADPQQFNRYLVTKGRKGGEFETVEVIKDKVDTKAIRELTQSMKALEGLIRSLNNIPTEAEMQRLQLEREKFEMEKEKWEREKAEQSQAHEVRVVFDTDDLEGWTE